MNGPSATSLCTNFLNYWNQHGSDLAANTATSHCSQPPGGILCERVSVIYMEFLNVNSRRSLM